MSYKFNGTTAAFTVDNSNSPVTLTTTLRSINAQKAAKKVRLSGAGATKHVYTVGIPKTTTTIVVVGEPTGLDQGASGALVVAWNGSNVGIGSLTHCKVKTKKKGGSVDGEVTTSITFVESRA